MVRSVLKYVFTALLFTLFSCIKEEPESCAITYVNRVKAVDISGKDISSTKVAGAANMYIFDHDKAYLGMMSVTEDEIALRSPIEYSHSGADNLWIVVWSNLKGLQTVTEPTLGMNMNDALVRMKRDAQNNAISPDDLFFGLKNVSSRFRNQTDTVENEIVIARMTARVNIVVKGLDPQFRDDYRFVVSDAKHDAYNFEGKLTGNEIQYTEVGKFNSDGFYLTPEPFTIFPVPSGNVLTVYVYKGNELLASVNTDDDGVPVTPPAGSVENIFIDLSQLPHNLRVNIIVTDWDEVQQWVEW